VIVLDTNVVSELMRDAPAESVRRWARTVPSTQRYLTATSVAELTYGAARLPTGRRGDTLERRVGATVNEDFAGQVLPFDVDAATRFGPLVAARDRLGRPIETADAQIAAICLHHGAALATRNTRDFDGLGLTLINPWEEG